MEHEMKLFRIPAYNGYALELLTWPHHAKQDRQIQSQRLIKPDNYLQKAAHGAWRGQFASPCSSVPPHFTLHR
jgi:hypothetical protein